MFALDKPLPLANEDSREYWEGCKRGELRLQRCNDCELVRFPPAILCPRCLSLAYAWRPMSGRGTVFSWIVVHRPQHPAFFDEAPYNVVIVELEEGARMHSRVVDCAPENLRIGLPVEVVFEKKSEDVTLPYFRCAQPESRV
jgi:uncharacterized OB-fold protein